MRPPWNPNPKEPTHLEEAERPQQADKVLPWHALTRQPALELGRAGGRQALWHDAQRNVCREELAQRLQIKLLRVRSRLVAARRVPDCFSGWLMGVTGQTGIGPEAGRRSGQVSETSTTTEPHAL